MPKYSNFWPQAFDAGEGFRWLHHKTTPVLDRRVRDSMFQHRGQSLPDQLRMPIFADGASPSLEIPCGGPHFEHSILVSISGSLYLWQLPYFRQHASLPGVAGVHT